MKKGLLLAAIVSVLLFSTAFSEEVIHEFWDIPFGIELEEAAKLASQKTGAVLEPKRSEEGELWYYSTPKERPLNVAGYPFEFRVSSLFGYIDKSKNDESFNHMVFESNKGFPFSEIEQVFVKSQKAIDQIYKMLCEKCGEPDARSYMLAEAGMGMEYKFDTPIKPEGTPNVIGMYEAGEKKFEMNIIWGNVCLWIKCNIYDDKKDIFYSIYNEPYVSMTISISSYASKREIVTWQEYKGDYFEYLESMKIGVTSF